METKQKQYEESPHSPQPSQQMDDMNPFQSQYGFNQTQN